MVVFIKKYEIRYDPENLCPSDDDMADRIWKAAWDLVRDVGYYNTDSHRLIQVTDEEIREALYMAHDQYWVGGGKDAVLWKHREIEDPEPPFFRRKLL